MKIDKHLKITMTRKQLCDLLMACTACDLADPEALPGNKWQQLHSELEEILYKHDEILFQRQKSQDSN